MKTLNGGEEYGWGGGFHHEDYPAIRLAAQANMIFRILVTTSKIGQLVLPVDTPRPPDLSLN